MCLRGWASPTATRRHTTQIPVCIGPKAEATLCGEAVLTEVWPTLELRVVKGEQVNPLR